MTMETIIEVGAQLGSIGVFVWYVYNQSKIDSKERVDTQETFSKERLAAQENFRMFLKSQQDDMCRVQENISVSISSLAVAQTEMVAKNTVEHGEILHRLRPIVDEKGIGD